MKFLPLLYLSSLGCSQCLNCLELLYFSENDPTLLLSVLGMSGVQLTKVEAEVRIQFFRQSCCGTVPGPVLDP